MTTRAQASPPPADLEAAPNAETRHGATPVDLLAAYRPGHTSLFASPRGTLLAEGVYFAVPPSARHNSGQDVGQRARAALRVAEAAGHDVRTVVGAVPFSPTADERLFVPQRLRLGGPPAVWAPRPATPGTPRLEVTPEPPGEQYADAVSRAVTAIRAGRYDKVVLARALRVESGADLEIADLLGRLAGRDPRAFVFAVDLGAGQTLLGASPELLVSRRGPRVRANPLAGSAARSDDPATDQARARALLASAKDRHEHAMVADAVAEGLRPLCRELTVDGPHLVATRAMWHLSTVVTATLTDPEVSALDLAARLHPTPAVAGSPADAALAAVADLEPHDRGFYAGAVGWSDLEGNGTWAVTLRCAVAQGRSLRLHAGAGVVADSDPQAELTETGDKFATMLGALGLRG